MDRGAGEGPGAKEPPCSAKNAVSTIGALQRTGWRFLKPKNKGTVSDPAISLLSMYLVETVTEKDMYLPTLCSTIYHSQGMEAVISPIHRLMVKEDVLYTYKRQLVIKKK